MGFISDQVYDRLKEEIVDGLLRPGERLSDREISARFGVSPTPVREALKRLEQEGFVERCGKFRLVRRLSVRDLRELYFVRKLLEPEACSLAASNSRSDALEELEGFLLGMEDCLRRGEHRGLDRFNRLFDERIYELSGNGLLERILKGVLTALLPYRAMATRVPERAWATYEEHRRIFEALKDGDPERARTMSLLHLKRAEEAVISLLEGSFALADSGGRISPGGGGAR